MISAGRIGVLQGHSLHPSEGQEIQHGKTSTVNVCVQLTTYNNVMMCILNTKRFETQEVFDY